MWRNWNPLVLLVGEQMVQLLWKKSLVIPQNTELQCNSTSRNIPRRIEKQVFRYLKYQHYSQQTIKGLKQPNCPSTDEWINKMWSICTMKYNSATKRNKVPKHTTGGCILETLCSVKEASLPLSLFLSPSLFPHLLEGPATAFKWTQVLCRSSRGHQACKRDEDQLVSLSLVTRDQPCLLHLHICRCWDRQHMIIIV